MRSLVPAAWMIAACMIGVPASSFGGIFVSVSIAPPALPVYVQPVAPGPDYIWTPGYWAYGDAGYFWVPGTWVIAPRAGLLWTPGYWGFGGGVYGWHGGYWGPHVGFYGGVNYGFGYGGVGFGGGRWVGGHFSYNTAVANVNTTVVHNTYVNNTVVNNTTVSRTSFNGQGGVAAQPTPAETAAAREEHVNPTSAQSSHETAAASDRQNLASVNHGRPANAAVAHPLGSPQSHANAMAPKGNPATPAAKANKPGPKKPANNAKGRGPEEPKGR